MSRSFKHGAGSGIKVIQENGDVIPELYDIFTLVSEAEAMLCTGHISNGEVLAVARAFFKGSYKGHFVYTHPDININQAPLEVQQEVAGLGGYVEKLTLAGHSQWGGVTVEQFIDSVRKIGPDRCFFATDAGGPDRPSSPETLQTFLAAALDAGLSETEIKTTIVDVPKILLNQ